MNSIKTMLWLLAILIFIVGCQKEPAAEIDEKFIGTWKHHLDDVHTVYMSIDSDSKGNIEKYENDVFKNDTQERKWIVKQNKLHFGWLSSKDEVFSIDQFPQTATYLIIHGLDTIQIGNKYMILDGHYYVD